MENKRIYPSRKKLITSFIIVALIILLIIYLAFGSRFNYFNKSPEELQSSIITDVIILVIWLIICGLFLYILLIKNYYVLTNSSLVHVRFTKELVYEFNGILYIDEEYTKKHKTLLFYTNKGDSRFLILDKENIIYTTLLNKCKNLLTRDQFHVKFPNIKL